MKGMVRKKRITKKGKELAKKKGVNEREGARRISKRKTVKRKETGRVKKITHAITQTRSEADRREKLNEIIDKDIREEIKSKDIIGVNRRKGIDKTNQNSTIKRNDMINREKLNKKEKENLEKYGVARCPDCGSDDIIKEHGEVYCKKCGFVIDEGYE